MSGISVSRLDGSYQFLDIMHISDTLITIYVLIDFTPEKILHSSPCHIEVILTEKKDIVFKFNEEEVTNQKKSAEPNTDLNGDSIKLASEFNTGLIVQCIQVLNNPQTHHQALVLLSLAAQLFPSQDDAYSFQVIVNTLKSVIPTLIEASMETAVEPVVTTVIHVFADALPEVPEYRRIPVFEKLLTTLDPEIYLGLVKEDGKDRVAPDVEFSLNVCHLYKPQVQLNASIRPRPDLDPDIVAALDDDFNFDDPDNELEDDFIAFANGVPSDAETDEDDGSSGDDEDEEDDDVLCDMRSDSGQRSPDFNDDTKSRFTEYSMTSSVIRRNAQLSLLDDRFEQMMAQYDDEEMGALDCEEIEGHITLQDEEVLKLAAAYEHDKTEGIRLGREIGKVARDEVEGAVERYLETYQSDDGNDISSSEGEQERKWDCESILSTYSNIYNHPKLISEPQSSKITKVCPKTGVPLNVLGKPGLTKKFLDQLDQQTDGTKKNYADTQSIISTLSTISIRPKDETPEQRTERKRLVKEYRQERRKEKKANSLAFKEEKQLQEKQHINNHKNISGIKLL
uniref:Protein LTV1 homolog n=1 Tax=Daphnia galeata TaxID=27404 RepID=A0A8J2WKC0_9CRUS|nr:unnamed protein product [Daphnia galeata]